MTRRHRIGEVAEKPWGMSRDAMGRLLCRWCRGVITAPRRTTFCSDACVHEWKLRSNPGYVRGLVLKRDRGVCASCGLDTLALQLRWRRSTDYHGIAEEGARHGFSSKRVRSVLGGKSPWEADHVVALVEGGGHGLDNVQTLCVGCHDRETAKLAGRRRR